MSRFDPEFLALPLEGVRSAALERASSLGCTHAELRVERIHTQAVSLRDAKVETTADDVELGMGLRVVHDGVIGFAATVELRPDAAAELAEQATALAMAVSAAATERVELAEESGAGTVEWVSEYEIDPTTVPLSDKVGLLEAWSSQVLDSHGRGPRDHLCARRDRGQALRRPRRDLRHPTKGEDPPGSRSARRRQQNGRVRDDADDLPTRRERVGVHARDAAGGIPIQRLPSYPNCSRPRSPPPRSSPATTTS